MKNWILIVTIFVFSFGFSSDVKRSGDDFFPNQETVRLFETHSPLITKVGVPGHTPPKTYNSREVGFTATLIDSSLNGYGPYNSRTNPLAYGTDEGYVAVYRQYMGEYTDGMSAGWIGAAQSEEGVLGAIVGCDQKNFNNVKNILTIISMVLPHQIPLLILMLLIHLLPIKCKK